MPATPPPRAPRPTAAARGCGRDRGRDGRPPARPRRSESVQPPRTSVRSATQGASNPPPTVRPIHHDANLHAVDWPAPIPRCTEEAVRDALTDTRVVGTFVVSEIRKQAAWSAVRPALHHHRRPDGSEVHRGRRAVHRSGPAAARRPAVGDADLDAVGVSGRAVPARYFPAAITCNATACGRSNVSIPAIPPPLTRSVVPSSANATRTGPETLRSA